MTPRRSSAALLPSKPPDGNVYHHLSARPAASVSYTEGETLGVWTHGHGLTRTGMGQSVGRLDTALPHCLGAEITDSEDH